MPRIQLNISDQHRLWIDTQTSEYFGISDVIRGLLDDAMGKRVIPLHMIDRPDTLPAYRVGAGDKETPQESAVSASSQEISKPSSDLGDGVGREPEGGPEEGENWTPRKYKQHLPSIKRSKVTPDREIRDNLDKHAELIDAYWRAKKGSKSDQAWALLQTELTKIQEVYGDDRLEEQLQLAINGLWKGITLRNMQRFESPKEKAAKEEPKHPASRVFTAEGGFGEAW